MLGKTLALIVGTAQQTEQTTSHLADEALRGTGVEVEAPQGETGIVMTLTHYKTVINIRTTSIGTEEAGMTIETGIRTGIGGETGTRENIGVKTNVQHEICPFRSRTRLSDHCTSIDEVYGLDRFVATF